MNKCRTDQESYHDPDDVMTPAEEREQEQKDFKARQENCEKFGSFMNHGTTGDKYDITTEILNEDEELKRFFVILISSYAGIEKDKAISPIIWEAIDKACRKYANEMLESGKQLPWRNE